MMGLSKKKSLTEMSQRRYDELTDHDGATLTDEEREAGWHFCPDWDFLLIGPGMQEMQACLCFRKLK